MLAYAQHAGRLQHVLCAESSSLSVLGLDAGTWPMDGGGVATCRELVLDYVKDVTWKVNAEIGNDYKKVWRRSLHHTAQGPIHSCNANTNADMAIPVI